MQLQPLADRVIVQPLKEEEKTPGGIYLPDTAKEKPQQGKVVAVGPGRLDDKGQRIEMAVKTGDRVVYSKYAGTEVEIGGEEYLILSESDILAIVQE
ncbi:MAG: co-chaperone GroES [Firmicutes bacterium ZCTH02-B6]|nr:MAG: co-chaperone GroES [Firmicutes bacterium ZCTH02-B6]